MANSNQRYLYHLTNKATAKKILKEGLIPQIGERSKLAGEQNSCIYLCDKGSVPYWRLLLGLDSVIRVDLSKLVGTPIRNSYEYYYEYLYENSIPPEALARVKVDDALSLEDMKDLLLSYIDSISLLCVYFVEYIAYKDSDDDFDNEYSNGYKKYFDQSARVLRDTLPRLDFSLLTKEEIRSHLHQMGDSGNYTLCDWYEFEWENSKKPMRLWQLLGKHELADEQSKWLYNWLKKTFPRQLRVETGGWTG